MKLNSDTNKLYRLAIIISFLLIIWFPNHPYLSILTLGLVLVEKISIKEKINKLGIFLIGGGVFIFFLDTPTTEQKLYTTIAVIIVAFNDVIKKLFNSYKSDSKFK